MEANITWNLQRYARLLQNTPHGEGLTWKVIMANDNTPLTLAILDSGYMIICQEGENYETLNLVLHTTVVTQCSNTLVLRCPVKGEYRVIRLQFDGSNSEEAIKACSRAVESLKKFSAVNIENKALPPENQLPAEPPAPGTQQQKRQETTARSRQEVVQGSVSVNQLTQHYLGENTLIFPQVYQENMLAQGNLERVLRTCLVDPNFHGLVERVELELKKLHSE